MEALPEKKRKSKSEKNFGEIIATYKRLGYDAKESISKAYFEMYRSDDEPKKRKEKKHATRKRKSRKDSEGVFGECETGNGSGKTTEASSSNCIQ